MTGGFFDFKRVRRRLRSAVVTGAGAVDSVDRILLRTQSDQGTGYGEIAPWPGFPTETIEQSLDFLRSAQGNLPHLLAAVNGDLLPMPTTGEGRRKAGKRRRGGGHGGEQMRQVALG